MINSNTMMDLSTIKPTPGSKFKKKREGRGRSGYGGKTGGRGYNGQKSRAGPKVRAQFEGGQTPLYRRLPKRQYISLPNRKIYTILNLSTLEKMDLPEGQEITPEFFLEKRLVKKLDISGLKILGNGELTKKLKLKVHSCTQSAKEKIEALGGTVTLIEQSE
ncbi:MAG: 50S ribosomal protein L15 [Candidatus Caenarcaniphilales bacterium]|nr:50S ribosomal protein L15 [Candidatus Caenarcaniphilales bacterium]